MKAVVCRSWDGPEALSFEEVSDPRPGAGEVLIEVKGAGVNFADTLMVQGKYQERPAFPFSPGLEVAGIVRDLGAQVRHVKAGDRVVAILDRGGYAELAVARESDVFVLPEAMAFHTAAGFPITYGTAHGGLAWYGGLTPEEVLLVHGAAGGVGLAAVEVGKAMGATVIATASSPERLELAGAHGADHLLLSQHESLREEVRELTNGRGADVVFDPVGGDLFEASLRCTAWGGRLLIVGFASGRVPQIPANLLLVKNISAIGVYWGSNRKHAPQRLRAEFEELFGWFEQDRLQPHVSHRLPLDRAAEAMALLRDRRSTGKVVLEP
jgi:NADPH2:quinone reductase